MGSYSHGIDNIFIHFDDDDGLYEAGQTLSGKIVVLVGSTIPIGGIKLVLHGKMVIKWMELEAGSMIPHEEHEILLNDVIFVFKPDFKDTYSKWLFPGRHVYNFEYQLPKNIPYSVDGSKYGRIEYKSKAEVNVLNSKPVESLEEEFFLHSRMEDGMEEEYLQLEATLPKENVEYGSLGGGCFVKKSKAEIFVKLEKNIYKQGQKIYPRVEVAVENGKCPIEGVVVLLVQEMIYMCDPGQIDELRKKEVLVVGECSSEESIEPGEKKEFTDLSILVEKNLPLTGFPHSDFIDVGYFVHAVAKVRKMNKWVV